jgi:glycerol uptake facilitator-like aquaporin
MAIIVGFTIALLGISFAYNCGNAINPARDFSPRLFTFLVGWGKQVFTAGNNFFWVPIVAPMVGSIFGTIIYILFISSHWRLSV